MSYSVVVVDDEPPARAKLKRWLDELADFRVAAEAGGVAEAIAAVSAVRPDVLYLDIQLGASSGFDVVDALRDAEASPLIVFTTAYSEYAVRAFDVQALDYLLKPFDRDRFLTSIERVRAALTEPDRSDVEERVRRLLAQLPGRAGDAGGPGRDLHRGSPARHRHARAQQHAGGGAHFHGHAGANRHALR